MLDDRSTDNSWDILQAYKGHEKVSHCLRNDRNSGSPFIQWKKGIELAKGEWIWIAESDDWCEKELLSSLITYSNTKIESGIVYAQSIDVNEEGVLISSRLEWTDEFKPNIWKNDWSLDGQLFMNSYLNKKNVIPNASAVIFKKSLTEGLDWDLIVQMKMCGDWLFWSIISANTDVSFLSKELNYFRNHHGVSRNHVSLDKKRARLLEEWRLRLYLKKKFNSPIVKAYKLQKAWFDSGFKVLDIVKSEFYGLNVHSSKLELALRFIKYKWLAQK